MLRLENPMLRIILLGIAICGLVIFFLPVTVHIINAGNLFGMGVSMCLLGFVLFNQQFSQLLDRIKHHSAGRIALRIVAGCIVLGILYCLILSGFMIHAANKNPKEKPAAIIVLGCKVRGTEPSLMLMRRIRAAYEAAVEYPDTPLILSGGQGSDEMISEAACMARELKQMGLPEQRLIEENRSVNTSENLRFSRDIMQTQGLEGPVIIVTDTFHEMRAQYLAKIEGYGECCAASTGTKWYLLPTYWVREWFGLTHAFVFGD